MTALRFVPRAALPGDTRGTAQRGRSNLETPARGTPVPRLSPCPPENTHISASARMNRASRATGAD